MTALPARVAPAATAAASAPGAPSRPAFPLSRRLEGGLLLASVAAALVFWIRLPGRLPGEEDYLAVQHALVADARPGDAVALLPFWAERGKLFVHGLPVVALPDLPDEADAERYPRLWVLAQPDLPRSDAAADLARLDRRLTRLAPARRFGPLLLVLYGPRAGRAATYDFTARLGAARVDVDGEPCEGGAGGLRCSRGPWNYVAPEWHEFDFLPRRCLWAHPVGEAPLTISYDGVPMEGGLRGGFGLVGGAAELPASRGFAPVELAVLVDGGQAATLTLSAGDPGWHPFELSLPGLAEGRHEVAFQVRARDPAMRHFCFDAAAF